MKSWLKNFITGIVAASIIMIPMFGANTAEAAPKPGAVEKEIVGAWVANFKDGKIQIHFHEDGCFHSHLEFKDEVSTFGEGTYSVSGKEVTLKYSRRIIDCDNDVTQQKVLQRSAQLEEMKFYVNFTEPGKRWHTNLRDYNVTFFDDEKTEAWAENHLQRFTKHKH